MSYVLADQHNWLSPNSSTDPFEILPIGDFAALRKSVNDSTADFFMWEHFTTNKYWQNGELKRIGEIYTPWPSWMIAARDPKDKRLEEMAKSINAGVKYFGENPEEAVEHITGHMHYSEQDAREWMRTVRFAGDVRGVDPGVVRETVAVLQKAGVLGQDAGEGEGMVAIKRAQRAKMS